MKFKKAKKLCRKIGMFVSRDGLTFTMGCGRLVNGEFAPNWIQRLNGCDVFEVAKIIKRTLKSL